jgi:arginyl-tRNA synthetase
LYFDPKEAVDLNGDTGSFIQYTYVRTKALWQVDGMVAFEMHQIKELHKEEEHLILHLAGL